MSTDPGYMLIRVDLQGARQAAAEAKMLQGSIAGVGGATAATGAQTAKQTSRGTRLWNGFTKAIKFGAIGVGAALAGIGLATKTAIEDMKDLGLVAAGLRRNLGLTAEQGSRWAAIARAREIAPTSLNMAFKTLSTHIKDAQEKGSEGEKTFRQLGLTTKEIHAGMKDFDGLIVDVADNLGRMRGGAKRQAIAAKLLGRGYQSVLPMFSDGAKGMKEYLGWADKYNVTMGDKMVDSTIDLANAQRESKVAWMGIQRVLAQEFMGSVTDAHGAFQDFAEDFTDPKLTSAQRWDLLATRLETGFTKASDWLLDVGIPKLAEGVGQTAPKIAGALVRGFMNANALGKIAIGWWLISRLTGKSMMAALGGAAKAVAVRFGTVFLAWFKGSQFGASMLTTFGKTGPVATKMKPPVTALGKWAGRLMGIGMAAALAFAFKDDIEKFFDDYADKVRETAATAEDAPPIIDLGGAPGDAQDWINENLDPTKWFRAAGGPVAKGKPYIVGEEGPEWFFPQQSGTVLPNPASGGDSVGGGVEKRGASVAGGVNLGDVTVVTPVYLDGKEVGRGVRRAALKSRARN